jgi:hypothetical protein
MIFVDGADGLTSFPAYDAVGFGSLDTAMKSPDEQTKEAAKKIGAPDLGGPKAWWSYVTNVMKVTPIGEKDGKKSTEGVKRLGGSFVIDGSAVTYAYADPLPGVEAPMDDLLRAALA